MQDRVRDLFEVDLNFQGNLIVMGEAAGDEEQKLTNEAFSEKWTDADNTNLIEDGFADFQINWYLQLYGFDTEENFAAFLQNHPVILDAGCGLGYKAAWMARLAPNSLVIGMDFSEAAILSSRNYADIENLFFVQGDISNTHMKPGSVSYVSCDQVLHHTTNPPKTFDHLASLLPSGGEFACYVYAKKALPRELIDEYFRDHTRDYSHEQVWELSRQLTELGKTLSELNVKFTSPDIPLLGIKGGEYDIQRFIYWNMLKCFWNPELGFETSVSTNFDWYSPTNAFRYNEAEFREMVDRNGLGTTFFHEEPACYSGRFSRS